MLLDIIGNPVLAHVIERIKMAIENVVVATTLDPSDDELVEVAEDYGALTFRGSVDDVLERIWEAADTFKADRIVDVTGDCPLVDPQTITKMLAYEHDYVSNIFPRSWPDGLDVQVYTREVLNKINEHVKDPVHRSHTGWNAIHYRAGFDFSYQDIVAPDRYRLPDWGLTIDTEEDYTVLKRIFEHFGHNKFSTTEVMDFLFKNPSVLTNRNIRRKDPQFES